MTIRTTWREISGLTAAQIATLQGHSARCSEATLQSMARECVEANELQVTYADVPTPEGAVSVDPWEDDGTSVVRTFVGSSSQIPVAEGDPWAVLTAEQITVEINGLQRPTGTLRWVTTIFPDAMDRHDLPIASARMLAESLSAAVAECERMNQADGWVR